MSKTDHISSPDQHGRLSEDRLLAYLDGKLSPAEQHEVEQWLADEGMENDAIEGLQAMEIADTKATISKLNHKLHHALHNKKKKRRTLKTDYLAWLAVVIILFLAVVAYIVIRKSL